MNVDLSGVLENTKHPSSATHDVVSREINPWKSLDLLLGSNV